MSVRQHVRDRFTTLVGDSELVTATNRGFEYQPSDDIIVDVRLDPGCPWKINVEFLDRDHSEHAYVPSLGMPAEIAEMIYDRVAAIAAVGNSS